MELIGSPFDNLKFRNFYILITLMLLSLKTFGQERDITKTYLDLSVTESVILEQDLLITTLEMKFEGNDTKGIQIELNKVMTEAAKIIKQNPEIEFTTKQYNVSKNHDQKDTRYINIHTVSQGIELKSINSQKLLQVVAELQNLGMLVQNLNYTTSKSKIEEINDLLITKVMSKLLSKAKLVAKSLNKEQVNVVEINFNGNNTRPPYFPIKAAVMDNVSPVVEAGKTEVSLTVHAKIAM